MGFFAVELHARHAVAESESYCLSWSSLLQLLMVRDALHVRLMLYATLWWRRPACLPACPYRFGRSSQAAEFAGPAHAGKHLSKGIYLR